jgi:hypothetical protein
MEVSVQFKAQFRFSAVEIKRVWRNRILAAKLEDFPSSSE